MALTTTVNPDPLSAHVQGMIVYNTATIADVVPGLYVNDGAKWAPLYSGTNPGGATVTAVCNGFTGNYASGAGTRTYTVTFTNNSFGPAQVRPLVEDLVLNPASGLTVASVSPGTATNVALGASLTVTYTLSGSVSAPAGTIITGTFTKLGLSCQNTVIAGNDAPIVSVGNAQTIIVPGTTAVTLNGDATDADGIASFSWEWTGGTGTAVPVITSPSSATTTVTGLTAEGTYIFTLTATDNMGAVAHADVTITATFTPESMVNGPDGTELIFMAHNLGADYSLDPHTPVQGIHGNYYQWGRTAVVATASTPEFSVGGWNTVVAANGAWSSTKTATDPCPSGYRIPTRVELTSILNAAHGNVVTDIGTSWTSNPSNFGNAKRITVNGNVRLTLPAAGFRTNNNGTLFNRASNGYYWTNTMSANQATDSEALDFGSNNVTVTNQHRTHGFTVRCIKE